MVEFLKLYFLPFITTCVGTFFIFSGIFKGVVCPSPGNLAISLAVLGAAGVSALFPSSPPHPFQNKIFGGDSITSRFLWLVLASSPCQVLLCAGIVVSGGCSVAVRDKLETS